MKRLKFVVCLFVFKRGGGERSNGRREEMSHRLLTTTYCNTSFPCLVSMLCVDRELVLVLLQQNHFQLQKLNVFEQRLCQPCHDSTSNTCSLDEAIQLCVTVSIKLLPCMDFSQCNTKHCFVLLFLKTMLLDTINIDLKDGSSHFWFRGNEIRKMLARD